MVMKEELVKIVGKENVSNDPGSLESYAGDGKFVPHLKPWYIVKPQNAEQVQELVKLANKTGTPLVPVSSGAPHYRGDSAPSVPGAVIVDLSGMKKILSINKTHRMAVIEPGVTYGELQAALKKEGLTISTSLAPRATKSVVSSVLETEPRLNSLHQWCFLDPLRCVEVTWGDGNRMFTGEAGNGVLDLKKQQEQEQWQWEPTGPMVFDFYRFLTGAQGTMGIVTWASVRCEIIHQVHKMLIVPADKLEDLVDFSYRVLRLRFSEEFFLMNGTYLASLLGKTPEEIAALRAELPKWVALVGVGGRDLLPEKRAEQQEADISEIAQQFGLEMKNSVNGVKGSEVLDAALNPSGENYWKETLKGSFKDIAFATTLDNAGKYIDTMYKLAKEANYSESDIGVYLQPENMGTSYRCEFTLPYANNCDIETTRMQKLFTKASTELSAMGAYFIRPYGIWAKLQLNRDAQSMSVLKDLKCIFDPNSVMNPRKLINY